MVRICQRGHKQTKKNLYVRPSGRKQCKKCIELYRKKPETIATIRRWQVTHPQNIKIINKRHRDTDEYREKNKHNMKKYYKGYIPKLQEEVLTHYGGGKMACVCCGETIFQFLTIDHMNGREQHEKKNRKYRGWMLKQYLRSHGYPEGYQTLCFNCNSGRALNKGVCPHEAKSGIAI